MTTDSNVARLIRDPSTGEMAWRKPSTDDLDLTTLPARLDDETLARVANIAHSPLPPAQPCGSQHFGTALRMMLAVLPRRHADDISGELFVAAYERQLSHYPEGAINHLCDEAIRTRQWFPTVAECLEILSGWTRVDEHTRRQRMARDLVANEHQRRRIERDEQRRVEASCTGISQEMCDAMPEPLRRLGLSAGYLVENEDGTASPTPDSMTNPTTGDL